MSRLLRLAFVLGLVACAGGAFAYDNFVSISTSDPDMAVAKQKARETLPDFLALVKVQRPTIEHFSIKVRIQDSSHTEFFWIAPFELNDGTFSGVVNNEPKFVRNVSYGQRITFTEADIADWLYVENGRMKGNFTACALIKRESKEAQEVFKKRHGLECDF